MRLKGNSAIQKGLWVRRQARGSQGTPDGAHGWTLIEDQTTLPAKTHPPLSAQQPTPACQGKRLDKGSWEPVSSTTEYVTM